MISNDLIQQSNIHFSNLKALIKLPRNSQTSLVAVERLTKECLHIIKIMKPLLTRRVCDPLQVIP